MPEDPAAPLAGTDDQVANLAQDADSGPWLTVDEVAARLQLTPAAVRAQLSGGVLAGDRVSKGRRLVWRVRAGAVPVDLRPQLDGDLEEEVNSADQAAVGTQLSSTVQGAPPNEIGSVSASPVETPSKKAGTEKATAADHVDRVDHCSAPLDQSGHEWLRLELARAKSERDAFKAALRALLNGLPD
ncbi:MAG: hypothetical protein M3529_11625 [Actinomycetota bacterium]|nr:hypothetical protein [Actinomycetota bacterium]MDQ3465607.1 hypothetical protein [Actinomycetota bacterium]